MSTNSEMFKIFVDVVLQGLVKCLETYVSVAVHLWKGEEHWYDIALNVWDLCEGDK